MKKKTLINKKLYNKEKKMNINDCIYNKNTYIKKMHRKQRISKNAYKNNV